MNLGDSLANQQDPKGAVAAYRRSLAVEPHDAPAWVHLGAALRDQKDLPGAVDAFGKAVAVEPRFALAWLRLGQALRLSPTMKGRRRPAERRWNSTPNFRTPGSRLPSIRCVRATFRKPPIAAGRRCNWPTPPDSLHVVGRDRLRQCEQMLSLEKRLKAVLDGDQTTPAEHLVLADLCCRYRKRYAEAVQLYAAAFTGQPRLAEDLNVGHRHRAAAAAVLAAASGSTTRRMTGVALPQVRH